jgi:hypothetical protein
VDLIAPKGDRLAPGAGVIFCTMWNSYDGQVLDALEGKWGGPQHMLLTGKAKLLHNPTGTGVDQLVAKTLHLSKTSCRHVPALVESLFNQVKAKAPATLKQKLVMSTDVEVMAIEKAFRFVGLFDESIRDVLKGIPQNAKRANLQLFKAGGQGKLVWDDYEAVGHSAIQFSCQVSRILAKDKKKKDRAEVRGAVMIAGHAATDGLNSEDGRTVIVTMNTGTRVCRIIRKGINMRDLLLLLLCDLLLLSAESVRGA